MASMPCLHAILDISADAREKKESPEAPGFQS